LKKDRAGTAVEIGVGEKLELSVAIITNEVPASGPLNDVGGMGLQT
jgi:hypothetical protein